MCGLITFKTQFIRRLTLENRGPMVEIVAELAQGFEGNVEKALLLLDAAHKSGADCAKFQVIFADEICNQVTNTTICSSL